MPTLAFHNFHNTNHKPITHRHTEPHQAMAIAILTTNAASLRRHQSCIDAFKSVRGTPSTGAVSRRTTRPDRSKSGLTTSKKRSSAVSTVAKPPVRDPADEHDSSCEVSADGPPKDVP